jgi:hypothetical protein
MQKAIDSFELARSRLDDIVCGKKELTDAEAIGVFYGALE